MNGFKFGLLVVGIVMALGAVLFFTLSPQESSTQAQVNSIVQMETTQTTENITEINIVVSQWKFEPARIELSKGEKVRLRITSIDVTHGILVPGLEIDTILRPGTTTTVEFTADKIGDFSFFCNISCGVGHGSMRGIISVR